MVNPFSRFPFLLLFFGPENNLTYTIKLRKLVKKSSIFINFDIPVYRYIITHYGQKEIRTPKEVFNIPDN